MRDGKGGEKTTIPDLRYGFGVNPVLEFLGFIGGMLLLAFVVSRITGARAQYLQDFPLENGERVLWEDLAADAYVYAGRRALFTTYSRSRRSAVRVTTLRIIAGTRSLFGQKHIIQYLAFPSDRAFPDEANNLGGGLLTRGFEAIVFERAGVVTHTAGKQVFVELPLDPAIRSSLNRQSLRIHSDLLHGFRLPD